VAEIDLDNGTWKLPAERTKANRSHVVHLSPEAVAILRALKDDNPAGAYVFPSPKKPDQPIFGRSVNNALSTLFKGGKLPNITRCHVHDLRRTLITRLPDLGYGAHIGEKIANHVLPGVLGVYNHNEFLPERKKALHEWSRTVVLLAAGDNVIQLQKSAA
jgi:integrase